MDSDDSDSNYSDYVDDLLDNHLDDKDQQNKDQVQDIKEEESEIHTERKKVILSKKNNDYFEVLPEGWIEVTHVSGMPIYLHKPSRVVSLSKPYSLGKGSIRKHLVPIFAIPCLQYKLELEKEQQKKKKDENNLPQSENNLSQADNNPSQSENNLDNNLSEADNNLQEVSPTVCPQNNGTKRQCESENESSPVKKSKQQPLNSVRVETVEEARKSNSLSALGLREYCANRFQFQEITVRKFKTWKDRRKFTNKKKMAERPSLPSGTKLITCPINTGQGERDIKREFVMNPAGKSDVCILHEYIQHTQRVQPKYRYVDLENAATPYSATVVIEINGIATDYGTGTGASKKAAKNNAALEALNILIPGYRSNKSSSPKSTPNQNPDSDIKDQNQDKSPPSIEMKSSAAKSKNEQLDEFVYFDDFKITDPNVAKVSATAGQYSPYQILVECLRRNHGLGDTDITFAIEPNVRKSKHKNTFTMTAGKHSVTIDEKNKTDGKQRAAQFLLDKLHPQPGLTWGSLLRLYGRGSHKTPKEKKEEEQKITELQASACPNKPNHAILDKLKEEMNKIHQLKTLDLLDMGPIDATHLQDVDL